MWPRESSCVIVLVAATPHLVPLCPTPSSPTPMTRPRESRAAPQLRTIDSHGNERRRGEGEKGAAGEEEKRSEWVERGWGEREEDGGPGPGWYGCLKTDEPSYVPANNPLFPFSNPVTTLLALIPPTFLLLDSFAFVSTCIIYREPGVYSSCCRVQDINGGKSWDPTPSSLDTPYAIPSASQPPPTPPLTPRKLDYGSYSFMRRFFPFLIGRSYAFIERNGLEKRGKHISAVELRM